MLLGHLSLVFLMERGVEWSGVGFSLGLKNVILDAFSASLLGFVDGSGFLDVSSVILVGSLFKLMRSAPRSGCLV